jgi:hypothetical protein
VSGPVSGLLDRIWFPPVPAARPALLRLAVGTYAVWLMYTNGVAWTKDSRQAAERFQPVGLPALFSAPLEPAVFDLVVAGTFVGLVVFVLGFGHRVLAPLTALAFCFVLAYRTSWGKVYHSDNLLWLQLFALAVTPSADAWSLDAWLARRGPGWRPLSWLRWPQAPRVDWRYGWSVQLAATLTAATYFLAGLAKVTGELGFGWATGQNLLAQIGKNAIQAEFLTVEGPTDTVLWAWQLGLPVLGGLAWGSLLLELLAPVALLHRWLGRAFAVATWCLHAGIHVLMDITFWFPMSGFAFLVFFPLERLLPRSLRDED